MMKILTVFLFIMLTAVNTLSAASYTAPKMRPYTGVGILFLPINNGDSSDQILLYDEPGLSRRGELNRAKIPLYDWIFCASPFVQPLIVMARKGTWLQVTYDDAGREAWLEPSRQMTFQPWDQFLKGNISRILPGLQKKYYQVFQGPGTLPVDVLTVKQLIKVLRIEGDWAMALIDQTSLGWLRWQDEDGRLLIGIVTEPLVHRP